MTTPPFDPSARVEKVATGAAWAEGPLWYPLEKVVRFSDIPNNRIIQLDPATGETLVWKSGVNYANGRAHHPDLGVVECNHGTRSLDKAPLVPFMDAEMLIDFFEGGRLNSPNDVAVHPIEHTIWFTDPPYGILSEGQGQPGEMEMDARMCSSLIITATSRPL